MRHVALKGYLGCEKQAFFFFCLFFGKNWADIKKSFIHVKNLGNRYSFCFAKWIHEGKRGSNRNPPQQEPLLCLGSIGDVLNIFGI